MKQNFIQPSAIGSQTGEVAIGLQRASKRAVFFDRDGVIVEEVDLLTSLAEIQIKDGVADALKILKQSGFFLFVATNQTVVSRGLITEQEVTLINRDIEMRLVGLGAPAFDGWHVCPHHPKATLEAYRIRCECRKPRPGMLLEAALKHHLNLAESFMIGDRITDIIAGDKAGCQTILLTSGAHERPPIETTEPLDKSVSPTFTCQTLLEAANWILKRI